MSERIHASSVSTGLGDLRYRTYHQGPALYCTQQMGISKNSLGKKGKSRKLVPPSVSH